MSETIPDPSSIPTPTPTTPDVVAPVEVVAAPATEAAAAPDPLDAPSLLNADAPAAAADPAADPAPVEGAPDAYELTAPEGFALDPAAVELATPVFKDLGLTNDAANKLMPVAAQFAKQITERSERAMIDAVVQQRATWAREALADAEIGGTPEHHAEVRQVVAKALDDFSPRDKDGVSPFRVFLDETGLGNHPEMIRFLHRAGTAISEEARAFRVDAGAATPKRPEQVMYAPEFQPKG